MSLSVVTPATAAPVSTVEARIQCSLDSEDTTHDTLLVRLISAASDRVEDMTSRCLMPMVFDLRRDVFPYASLPLRLPLNPVTAVSAVNYYDEDDVLQTIDVDALYFTPSHIATLVPREVLGSWPSVHPVRPEPVIIRLAAGYADAASVPHPLKAAILLLVAHWFGNREAVLTGVTATTLPLGVEDLVDPYRIREAPPC